MSDAERETVEMILKIIDKNIEDISKREKDEAFCGYLAGLKQARNIVLRFR